MNLLFQKKIVRSQKFEIVLIDKRPKKICPYRPTFGRFVLIDKRPSGPTQLYIVDVKLLEERV